MGGAFEFGDLLPLLRQKFLILFTDINVALFAVLPAFGSSVFTESVEKRLVVDDRGLPWTGCSRAFTSADGPPLPMVAVSHVAPACCNCWGGSGVEGCRPNGSGDRGITDDSESFDGGLGGCDRFSSSSSCFRRSLSDGPLDGERFGIYERGAEVVTPLTAKRGGDGGPLPLVDGRFSLSLIDEKGTAGHDCPAKYLKKTDA